jgi:hypothetical protein
VGNGITDKTKKRFRLAKFIQLLLEYESTYGFSRIRFIGHQKTGSFQVISGSK